MDASAIVTRVLGRNGSNELEAFISERSRKPLGTSTLGLIETVRTCDRYGTFPHLMPELRDVYTEVLVTDEVRDTATHMPESIRTLNSVHVASAESLEEYLTMLVSYDERIAASGS